MGYGKPRAIFIIVRSSYFTCVDILWGEN